jgi:molybdate transport system regulatory protein
MASKNLKAIAVRGTRGIKVHDPEGFFKAMDVLRSMASSIGLDAYVEGSPSECEGSRVLRCALDRVAGSGAAEQCAIKLRSCDVRSRGARRSNVAPAVFVAQHRQRRNPTMKYGARNRIQAKVTSIKKGDIMSLVKFEISVPAEMASVMTTESLEALELKVGEKLELIVKAIHVLPVKE